MKAHRIFGEWVVRSLFERDGVWYGRARHLRTRRMRYLSTREKDRRKAEQKVLNWIKKLEAEDQGKPQLGTLFSKAFEEWLGLKELRASTQREYGYSFTGVYEPFFGEMLVGGIRLEDVERFLVQLRDHRGRRFKEAKGWDGERKLSRRTRQKHLSTLRSFFRWARLRRYCKEDPTEGINIPRATKRQGIALSFLEAQKLLWACRDEAKIVVKYSNREASTQTVKPPSYLFLAVLIGLHTGLRKGNVTGMRWKHVDLGKGKICFAAEEMKANADLEIPIHPELLEVLKAQAGEKGKLDPNSPVLGEEVDSFKRSFRWALKQAGLPYAGDRRVRFHDLRHTLSTWLAVRYPQAIKDAMLGHAPRGVSGLYTHVPFEELKKAIDRMPRLLEDKEEKVVNRRAPGQSVLRAFE